MISFYFNYKMFYLVIFVGMKVVSIVGIGVIGLCMFFFIMIVVLKVFVKY